MEGLSISMPPRFAILIITDFRIARVVMAVVCGLMAPI
jgi:hypothetical protein